MLEISRGDCVFFRHGIEPSVAEIFQILLIQSSHFDNYLIPYLHFLVCFHAADKQTNARVLVAIYYIIMTQYLTALPVARRTGIPANKGT